MIDNPFKGDQHLVKSKGAIDARVKEMGAELRRRFWGKDVTAVPVLNGALIFAADLVRETEGINLEIQPVRVESYAGDKSTHDVLVDLGALSSALVDGRHVLIIEDILDTGRTLNTLVGVLKAFGPESLTIAVLVHKHEKVALPMELPKELVGFPIDGDPFIVGYGIDFRGKYRSLPNLRQLPEKYRV